MKLELSEDNNNSEDVIIVKKWINVTKVCITLGVLIAPFLISMMTWKVNQIANLNRQVKLLSSQVESFRAAGPRYTKSNAAEDAATIKKETLNYVYNNYPPQWVRDAINDNKSRIFQIEKDLKTFESEFTSDFIRKEELDALLKIKKP